MQSTHADRDQPFKEQESIHRQVRQPTDRDLEMARSLVAAHLAPSPIVSVDIEGRPVLLKLESLQPTGSFKVRGALVAMSAVPANGSALAVSAGNHALGIGWASARLGIPATVVIAETASPAKRAKLEQLPITLIRHGASYDEAERWAIEQAAIAPAGTVFISAYNDPLVIAGASTVMDEILAQVPDGEPLTLIVPASGGGLLAGISLRASQLSTAQRPIRIVAVELETSPALSAALDAGRVVHIDCEPTIADGLSGNFEPGSVTVDIVADKLAGVVTIPEHALHEAIRFLAGNVGLIAEGAGAAATAAVCAGLVGETAGTVVAIVSGRNIAMPLLTDILS
jgi:threonine dehydratase